MCLADGERHGYAIKREIAERTGGRIELGPCSLYGAIKNSPPMGRVGLVLNFGK